MKLLFAGLALATSVSGLDIWDVLQADVTCCPKYANDADACGRETASSCVWINEAWSAEAQAIAKEKESQCLGETYVNCRLAGEPCCTPKCQGNSNPALRKAKKEGLDEVVDPVCELAPKLPDPTPFPTKTLCKLDQGYNFAGYGCSISGDPHTKMFSGVKHDFQGQPLSLNRKKKQQNSFYYIATCSGYNTADMPIQIMGTHYHWGTRPVSGIDYLTIELYYKGSMYWVYFSSDIAAYKKASSSSSKDYDKTLRAGDVTKLMPGSQEVNTRFLLTYTSEGNNANLVIKIAHEEGITDSDAEVKIFMSGQMDEVNGRKRMHYVYISQDDLYKCASCGLCGNFRDDGNSIERCNGLYSDFRSGWDMTKTPEAYDYLGWSYEYNYFQDECNTDDEYNIHDNTGDFEFVNPCDPLVQPISDKACEDARNDPDIAACCAALGGKCDEYLEDCKADACIISTDLGATEDFKDPAINAARTLMSQPVKDVCALPGFLEANNPWNMVKSSYIGCTIDNSGRTMEILDWNVPTVTECIGRCSDKGYTLAGFQYGKECFCSNSLKDTTALGYRTEGDLYKCIQFQRDDPRFKDGPAWGCKGGSWTQCIYQIKQDQEARVVPAHMYAKFGKLSEEEMQQEKHSQFISAVQVTVGNGIEKHYLEMAVAGVVVMALVGGMVVYSKRNKFDKYAPLLEPTQV